MQELSNRIHLSIIFWHRTQRCHNPGISPVMILASMRLNKNAHKDDRIKSFQNTDVLAKLLEIAYIWQVRNCWLKKVNPVSVPLCSYTDIKIRLKSEVILSFYSHLSVHCMYFDCTSSKGVLKEVFHKPVSALWLLTVFRIILSKFTCEFCCLYILLYFLSINKLSNSQ